MSAGPATAEPVELAPMDDADLADAVALAAGAGGRDWTAAVFAAELAAPGRDYRVARRAGEVVGVAGAWDAPDVTHLMACAVAGPHRRTGIGRRLLDDLFERALARGATAMTLEVRADATAARRLYEAAGFRTVGCRPGYYGDVDAVLMTRHARATT